MVRLDLNRALAGMFESLIDALPEILAFVLATLILAAALRWSVSRVGARRRPTRPAR